MQITNNARYDLVAFGWHMRFGVSEVVIIRPKETKDVNGPRLGTTGGGTCDIAVPGEITCHGGPDDLGAGVYQVLIGYPLNLRRDNVGVTVRHHRQASAFGLPSPKAEILAF